MTKIFQMPEAQYRMIDAVSSSDLRAFAFSPRKYWLTKQFPSEETDDTVFGTLFHCAILEPEKFRDIYTCEPSVFRDGRPAGIGEGKVNRNSNAWKEYIAEWREQNKSKTAIHPDDFAILIKMMTAVSTHPKASKFLRDTEIKKEVCTMWEDGETGLKCKARADILHAAFHMDLKTTKCTTPDQFERESYYKYLYHIQSGFYDEGFTKAGYNFDERYILAATKDKTDPQVFVMRIDGTLLERGKEKARRLMDRFNECRIKNKWPGFDEIYDMMIPNAAIVEFGDG